MAYIVNRPPDLMLIFAFSLPHCSRFVNVVLGPSGKRKANAQVCVMPCLAEASLQTGSADHVACSHHLTELNDAQHISLAMQGSHSLRPAHTSATKSSEQALMVSMYTCSLLQHLTSIQPHAT